MKVTTSVKRLKPNTVLGNEIEVKIIYSSFNEHEINEVYEMLIKSNGAVSVVEVEGSTLQKTILE